MDTWTGPREPIAKKIPLSSRLWTSAINRHSVRPYLEGYRIMDHCPSSRKYSINADSSRDSLRFSSLRLARGYSLLLSLFLFFFFFLFFYFLFQFIPCFSRLRNLVCGIFATAERERERLEREHFKQTTDTEL